MSGRRIGLAAAALLALAGPAAAHRLKLFATVEDGTIAGYAFFVGGGRPEAAALAVRDGAGSTVHRGATGPGGDFSWRPAAAGDYVVSIDAGDGHVAEARIGAERFSPGTAAAAVPAAAAEAGPPSRPALDAARLDAAVERAVARQIRPLLEAYSQAEARLRFNDVAGGVGMIVGLAGLAAWFSARRRRPGRGDGA